MKYHSSREAKEAMEAKRREEAEQRRQEDEARLRQAGADALGDLADEVVDRAKEAAEEVFSDNKLNSGDMGKYINEERPDLLNKEGAALPASR